jgi:hypothetical protein
VDKGRVVSTPHRLSGGRGGRDHNPFRAGHRLCLVVNLGCLLFRLVVNLGCLLRLVANLGRSRVGCSRWILERVVAGRQTHRRSRLGPEGKPPDHDWQITPSETDTPR